MQAPIRNNSFARAAIYSALVSETVVVTVKPNSRKGPLVEVGDDGALTVYVREPATEGKTTKTVGALLAKHFRCSQEPRRTDQRSDRSRQTLPVG